MDNTRYAAWTEDSRRTGTVVHMEDKKAGVRMSCMPKFGFLWSGFDFDTPGGDAVEMLHRGKIPPTEMDDGMCPILFPIVGRLRRGNRQGSYRHEGKLYKMDIHGFAKDLPWEILDVQASADGCFATARLSDTAATRRQYPWRFSFQLTYRVIDGTVQVISYVNSDGPWSLGFHPYFRLPLAGLADDRSHCTVRIPVTKRWEEKHLVPTGKVVATGKKFPLMKGMSTRALACDEAFSGVVAGLDGWYAMVYFDSRAKAGVSIECDDKVFSEVVIYCQKDEPYICIEPWTSPPNSLNTGWRLFGGGTSVKSAITYRPIFKMPKRAKHEV